MEVESGLSTSFNSLQGLKQYFAMWYGLRKSILTYGRRVNMCVLNLGSFCLLGAPVSSVELGYELILAQHVLQR